MDEINDGGTLTSYVNNYAMPGYTYPGYRVVSGGSAGIGTMEDIGLQGMYVRSGKGIHPILAFK